MPGTLTDVGNPRFPKSEWNVVRVLKDTWQRTEGRVVLRACIGELCARMYVCKDMGARAAPAHRVTLYLLCTATQLMSSDKSGVSGWYWGKWQSHERKQLCMQICASSDTSHLQLASELTACRTLVWGGILYPLATVPVPQLWEGFHVPSVSEDGP